MNYAFEFWLFGIALGASALGGMLGMASGIFIVPVLTMFGHTDIHTAIGASLVSVIVCSCSSAAPFLKARLTNIRLAIILETATTLGAVSGVMLTGIIPTNFLFLLFAAILILSAGQMLMRRVESNLSIAGHGSVRWPAPILGSSYPDRVLGREVPYRVERLTIGMMLMYGAGMISALLGIGSGVLKIPAMDAALRLPIKVSSATSNFMIGVTAAAGAAAYFIRGDISTTIAGPIALGSVAGAMLGARVLMAISNEKIRSLFVFVLLALAGVMLCGAFGIDLVRGAA